MISTPLAPSALAQLDQAELKKVERTVDEICSSAGICGSFQPTIHENTDTWINLIDAQRGSDARAVESPKTANSGTNSTQEAAISEGIEFELMKSGYPLQQVRCHCRESTLELTGVVWRFYYLQQTLEIARRFAGGRRIVHRIAVVAGPDAVQFDDED